MLKNQFTLPPVEGNARRLVTGWLLIGLSALLVGGLFTILVVLSRTPYFQEIVPWKDFFHTALVVHVNLTVLVWFLAFAGVFWSYTNSRRCLACGWIALLLAALGTATHQHWRFLAVRAGNSIPRFRSSPAAALG